MRSADHRRPLSDGAEIKSLKSDYHKLRNHYAKVQLKADDQAKLLKDVRKTNEVQRKELTSLRRKYDQLVLDKIEVDEQSQSNREYAQRVEQNLLMGSKGQYLCDKNNELREKIRVLKAEAEEKNQLISSQEAELHKSSAEMQVMARAMDACCNEAGIRGNDRSLLLALAEKREESTQLALELGSVNDKLGEVRGALAFSQSRAEKAEKEAEQRQSAQAVLTTELEALKGVVGAKEEELLELQHERGVMLDYIRDMNAKLAETEQAVAAASEREADRERGFQLQALSEAEARVRAEKQSEELRNKLDALSRVVSVTEAALGAERARLEKKELSRRAAEDAMEDVKEEVDNLHTQISLLQEQNLAARGKLEANQKRYDLVVQNESEATKNQKQLEERLAEKDRVESLLKGEMESALEDLQRMGKEREAVAQQMSVAVNMSAEERLRSKQLEAKVAALESDKALLVMEKQTLQRKMLDELAKERIHRQQAEATAKQFQQQEGHGNDMNR